MAQIDQLLKVVKDRKGSDLHLSPGNPPLARISGELTPLSETPLSPQITQQLLYEIMTAEQRAVYEETHDLDFGYPVPALDARFRSNVFEGRLGMGGVFRLIPTQIKSLKELALPDIVSRFTEMSKGLVLVTGGTGSGKSTTLAAMVDHINANRHEHILTVEDPIEFVYPGRKSLINQREVGSNTKSFAAALKAALREDPDVILVGEMRDLETIELAITAAETGHLVFGTLHTSSAAKTVDRIINVFPTTQQAQIRTMLSESLKGVIAQNLLRTPEGGRVAALEIMVGTPALSNLIREGKTFQIPSIIQTGKRDGMVSMEQAIRNLMAAGRITLSEARAYLPEVNVAESSIGREAVGSITPANGNGNGNGAAH
jgi:twitching motility protein PilT